MESYLTENLAVMSPGMAFLVMIGMAVVIVIIMLKTGIVEVEVKDDDGKHLELDEIRQAKPKELSNWLIKGFALIAKKLEPKESDEEISEADEDDSSKNEESNGSNA